MEEDQDYYEILGLEKNCTIEQIKNSYKKMALQWHPDKNKENSEHARIMFQKISEAYSVLCDPEKRKKYDKYGKAGDDQFDFEEFMHGANFQDIFGMMSDIFSDFDQIFNMGGRNKKRGKHRFGGKQKFTNKNNFQFYFGDEFKMQQKKVDEKLKKNKKDNQEDEWETQSEEEGWEDEEEFEDDQQNQKKQHENQKNQNQQKQNNQKQNKSEKKQNSNITDAENNENQKLKNISKQEKQQQKKKTGNPFNGNNEFELLNQFMKDMNFPDNMMDDLMESNEMLFPMFVAEKTIEIKNFQFKCKFDEQILNEMNLMSHFEKKHQKEFQKWVQKQNII